MRILLACFLLLPLVATSAPTKIPFTLSGSLPFSIVLVLPASGTVTSHLEGENADEIRARIEDDREGGLSVETIDTSGDILWKRDFGYNLSAPEGNTISVTYDPNSGLILIHFHGYKFDDDYGLLFVNSNRSRPVIREYTKAQQDILPLLKRRKDFPSGYRYAIRPLSVEKRSIEFQCIPIQKLEKSGASPWAHDQPWYMVSAVVDSRRRIVPKRSRIEY